MPDPRPNLDLLRRVLRHIDDFPETWNQDYCGVRNECGTTHCIAGHALVMAGVPLKWEEPDDVEGDEILVVVYHTKDGVWWNEAAQEVLGLTHDEAEALFSVGNTREMIEEFATEIAARAGEELWPEPVEIPAPSFMADLVLV